MSYVSNIVVHVHLAPPEVHKVLAEEFRRLHWRDLGTSKAFEDDVYTGASNYLEVDNLEKWFESLSWDGDSAAMMSIGTEDEQIRILVVQKGSVAIAQ